MSSEKYELAQDEVDNIIEKLKSNIKKTEAAQGEAKKRIVQVIMFDKMWIVFFINLYLSLKVCSGQFEDVSKSLDDMDSEAKSAPLQFRAEMLANVRKYRREVNSLQTQFTKARVDRRKDSNINVGFNDVNINVPVQDQYRQQVLAGTQILSRTGESLNRAQQIAIETDEVGEYHAHDHKYWQSLLVHVEMFQEMK